MLANLFRLVLYLKLRLVSRAAGSWIKTYRGHDLVTLESSSDTVVDTCKVYRQHSLPRWRQSVAQVCRSIATNPWACAIWTTDT